MRRGGGGGGGALFPRTAADSSSVTKNSGGGRATPGRDTRGVGVEGARVRGLAPPLPPAAPARPVDDSRGEAVGDDTPGVERRGAGRGAAAAAEAESAAATAASAESRQLARFSPAAVRNRVGPSGPVSSRPSKWRQRASLVSLANEFSSSLRERAAQ